MCTWEICWLSLTSRTAGSPPLTRRKRVGRSRSQSSLKSLAGAKPGDISAQEVMIRQMETQVSAMLKELERARQLAARKAIPDEALEQKQLAYDREVLQCEAGESAA